LRGGLGVGALRTIYGHCKHRGPRPNFRLKASGAVLRHIVKQLEQIGVVEKLQVGGGRKISREGQKDLDRIATRVASVTKKKGLVQKEINAKKLLKSKHVTRITKPGASAKPGKPGEKGAPAKEVKAGKSGKSGQKKKKDEDDI